MLLVWIVRTGNALVASVKEQCLLDIRKYSFLPRPINEQTTISDCVDASSVSAYKYLF